MSDHDDYKADMLLTGDEIIDRLSGGETHEQIRKDMLERDARIPQPDAKIQRMLDEDIMANETDWELVQDVLPGNWTPNTEQGQEVVNEIKRVLRRREELLVEVNDSWAAHTGERIKKVVSLHGEDNKAYADALRRLADRVEQSDEPVVTYAGLVVYGDGCHGAEYLAGRELLLLGGLEALKDRILREWE